MLNRKGPGSKGSGKPRKLRSREQVKSKTTSVNSVATASSSSASGGLTTARITAAPSAGASRKLSTDTANKPVKNGSKECPTSQMAITQQERQALEVASKTLSQANWYWGYMPREDCDKALKNVGDFVVRRTTNGIKASYILATKTRPDNEKHIQIHYDKVANKWFIIGEVKRDTIELLVRFYRENPCPAFSKRKTSLLTTPVPRPEHFILHENIVVGRELGHGAFGTVHEGSLKISGAEVKVAVKKLSQTDHLKQRLKEFLTEGKLMLKLKHPNIVQMYGVAPGDVPVLIVLELAEGGSLKSYCKKNMPVPTATLVNFAKDALRGMTYLQFMKVIHRDLAARNCLLGADAVLKISDFGLSHEGEAVPQGKLVHMPVKWLAPEVFKIGQCSHKTDVWAYGVLLWEIFTRCTADPFTGMKNNQARLIIETDKTPTVLTAPPGTPPEYAEMLKQCFIFDPAKRPDFEVLFRKILPTEKSPLEEDKIKKLDIF